MEMCKVVILCGGQGTRLREETEFRPKPMVAVGGRPILWHIMKIYSSYGFDDFVLCLGYKGDAIKEYFYNYEIMNNDFTLKLGERREIKIYNNHRESGWRITFVETGEGAMTGARLKRAEQYVDTETFMLTYGDGLADINIAELLRYHRSHGKTGTITGVCPQSRFGKLMVEDRKVARFSEKPKTQGDLINGGFFLFERRFFGYLSREDSCVLENEPLERLSADGELMVYPHEGFWQCMDTYRDMQLLNVLWESKEHPWKIWD